MISPSLMMLKGYTKISEKYPKLSENSIKEIKNVQLTTSDWDSCKPLLKAVELGIMVSSLTREELVAVYAANIYEELLELRALKERSA